MHLCIVWKDQLENVFGIKPIYPKIEEYIVHLNDEANVTCTYSAQSILSLVFTLCNVWIWIPFVQKFCKSTYWNGVFKIYAALT